MSGNGPLLVPEFPYHFLVTFWERIRVYKLTFNLPHLVINFFWVHVFAYNIISMLARFVIVNA